jgi:hypothetical protein
MIFTLALDLAPAIRRLANCKPRAAPRVQSSA